MDRRRNPGAVSAPFHGIPASGHCVRRDVRTRVRFKGVPKQSRGDEDDALVRRRAWDKTDARVSVSATG